MRQTDIRYLYILPEKLQISGNIETENLKRGLYDIVVYRSSIKLSGSFDFTDLQQKNITGQEFLLNEAKLIVGISDLRGIIGRNDTRLPKIKLLDTQLYRSISS